MTYRFRCRDTGRFIASEGTSRLDAAISLPIGSWDCYFVETATTVEPYDPHKHGL